MGVRSGGEGGGMKWWGAPSVMHAVVCIRGLHSTGMDSTGNPLERSLHLGVVGGRWGRGA